MELLTVGQIVNIFGTGGELKIVSHSDFSSKRYKIGNRLLLKDEATGHELETTVVSYRRHRGLDLVKFEGIDATNAIKFFGYYVMAPKDDIKLPKDTYFHSDLVGCRIHDEKGRPQGVVEAVVDYGAHPILKVVKDEVTKYQIPFVPFFILKVDIAEKTITVNFIDGML